MFCLVFELLYCMFLEERRERLTLVIIDFFFSQLYLEEVD